MAITSLGVRLNQNRLILGILTNGVVILLSTTLQMVRLRLMLKTMLPLSTGVILVVCQILQNFKNYTANAVGHGSQISMAQAVIS